MIIEKFPQTKIESRLELILEEKHPQYQLSTKQSNFKHSFLTIFIQKKAKY